MSWGEARVLPGSVEAHLCFKSVASQRPWKFVCGGVSWAHDRTVTGKSEGEVLQAPSWVPHTGSLLLLGRLRPPSLSAPPSLLSFHFLILPS